LMSIIILLSVALGAAEELDFKAGQPSIDKNNKGSRTLLWSPIKEKEIPFGD